MTDVNDVVDSLDNEYQAYINTLTNDEFHEIIAKARDDSEKMTEEDINNIIDTIEIPDNHYLENKNTESILSEINDILLENNITNHADIISKLTKYKYVDEISEICKGRNIKYINKNTNKFNNAGLVLDIKFLKNGTHILCKGFNNFVKQIKLNYYIIFQLLTTEEQLILMSNSVIL